MSNTSANVIIHGAATSAAAVASGMAQLPGSDNAIITPIQVSMIIALGKAHGRQLDESMALCILAKASAGYVGRAISQFLVGWIPGFGNVINATTAFSLTEAIGWSANAILEDASTTADAS